MNLQPFAFTGVEFLTGLSTLGLTSQQTTTDEATVKTLIKDRTWAPVVLLWNGGRLTPTPNKNPRPIKADMIIAAVSNGQKKAREFLASVGFKEPKALKDVPNWVHGGQTSNTIMIYKF